MSRSALCTVTGLPQKGFFLGDPTQGDVLRSTHGNVGSTEMLNYDRKCYISNLAAVSGAFFLQDALISLAGFALYLSTGRL